MAAREIFLHVFLVTACLLVVAADGERLAGSAEKYNVTIRAVKSPYQILDPRGGNFTFSCSVSGQNGTVEDPHIKLKIFGDSEKKLAKVTNKMINDSILFSYNITNYIDDQTVFACIYSKKSHSFFSSNLTLTVFYGPGFMKENMTQMHGDNGTDVNITVGVIANPPVMNYTWTLNGKELSNSSNVKVMRDELTFTPLLRNATGNYSMHACNNISCNSFNFPLVVYYAPLFAGNLQNATMLTEIFNGRSRNLNCTVVDYVRSLPLSLNLTTERNPLSHVNYTKTNSSSITVFITNASKSDATDYVCYACSGNGTNYCSYLGFDTYVGGPPSASNLNISCSSVTDGTKFHISCSVADTNPAPVTTLQFTMPYLDFNTSLKFGIDDIPIHDTFSSLFTGSLESIFAGSYSLQVMASNYLGGGVLVHNESIHLDGLSNITILPNNSIFQTLDHQKNFTFTCMVHELNGTVNDSEITLSIPGDQSKEKLAKVTKKTIKNGMVFTYPITNYTDDQTVFFCQYIHNNRTMNSTDLTLTVFYGPHFAYENMTWMHGDNGTDVNVTVGLIANPAVVNYTWTLNGNKLSNSSNVKVLPGELRFTPLLLNAAGNYSMHTCNNISCNSFNFPLTVYYGPSFTIENMTQMRGDNGTDVNITVGLIANPPVMNYTWTLNRKELSNSSNVKVMSGELHFTPLLRNATGNYSVHACNNLSCSSLDFPLVVYYAPLFAGNLQNFTMLTEIQTGTSRNLTCTVVEYLDLVPLSLNMTTERNPSSNVSKVNFTKTNSSSITIFINNANESNAVDYVCYACSGNDTEYCSYLGFDTYVGGRPDNTSLLIQKVMVSEPSNGKYNLTIVANFTDNSDVPVTQLKYSIRHTSLTRNISVNAPLAGEVMSIQSSTGIEANLFGGDSYVSVDFFAANYIGSTSLTMITATLPLVPTATPSPTPTSPSAKPSAVVIAVAVLVPLAFIVFLTIAGVGGYIYYKKHKHPKGFSRLIPNNDEPDNGTDGVYDAT